MENLESNQNISVWRDTEKKMGILKIIYAVI